MLAVTVHLNAEGKDLPVLKLTVRPRSFLPPMADTQSDEGSLIIFLSFISIFFKLIYLPITICTAKAKLAS